MSSYVLTFDFLGHLVKKLSCSGRITPPFDKANEKTSVVIHIWVGKGVLIINKPFKVGPFLAGFPGTDPSFFSYQSVREKPAI